MVPLPASDSWKVNPSAVRANGASARSGPKAKVVIDVVDVEFGPVSDEFTAATRKMYGVEGLSPETVAVGSVETSSVNMVHTAPESELNEIT